MTLKRFGHIALCLIAGLAGISCDGDRNAGTPDPIPAENMVNLAFSVVAPDAVSQSESRAIDTSTDQDNYFEREASKYEKIHTLRIIILRPGTDFQGNPVKDKDGKPILDPTTGNPYDKIIEQNRFFTLDDNGVVRYDDMNIKVHGGENKTIYIIANEDGINSNRPEGETEVNLSALAPNMPYVPDTIEDILIHADANGILYDNTEEAAKKTYIPMAEVYEDVYIEMPKTIELREQKVGPFFITRAAVKFSFNIKSDYGEGLYLKSLTFNSLADREYLLPRETEYYPAKPTFHNGDNSDYTDGIKNPSNTGDTSIDPDLSGRFITKYEIPVGTNHNQYTFNLSTPLQITEKNQSVELPELYFCESKVINTSNENPYSVGITIAHYDVDSDGKKVEVLSTFNPVQLPNLPLLPRNTHVKVNIALTDGVLMLQVDLVPYIGIDLEPIFGFDELIPKPQ